MYMCVYIDIRIVADVYAHALCHVCNICTDMYICTHTHVYESLDFYRAFGLGRLNTTSRANYDNLK